MKIERIDSRTIKVVLSDKDMAEYDLTYEEMDYSDSATRQAILEIMRRVQNKINLGIDHNKLFIEAFPSPEGGCILYVNIVEFEPPEKPTVKAKKELPRYDTPLIFELENLDAVTAVCKRLATDMQAGIVKSSLFHYEAHYYLLLYTYCRMERKIQFILQEYGDFLGKSTVLAAFFREHSKEISRDDAISTIVRCLG